MNRIERHQALRRIRKRIFLKRTLVSTIVVIGFFFGWEMLSEYSPIEYTPPPPVAVGERLVAGATEGVADGINATFETALPKRRDVMKRSFLAKVEKSVKQTLESVTDDTLTLPILRRSVDTVKVIAASRDVQPKPLQSYVNILLIGLDTRMGKSRGRADAIHLFSLDLETPSITITAIPRGTPYRLGYENPSSNIISHVRSARGREALIKAVRTMVRKTDIPYFVEVGFSQAIGVLELLGYDDPMMELQALRMRKGFQHGDHDRAYNQALFLKRALPMVLRKAEGLTGELLLSAGLRLVETNLPKEFCQGLIYTLNDAGFNRSAKNIHVEVFGKFKERFAGRSEHFDASHTVARVNFENFDSTTTTRAERLIRNALSDAVKPNVSPASVKGSLWNMFRQRAWLQIPDKHVRVLLRDSLAASLRRNCLLLKDTLSILTIERTMNADNVLLQLGANP